MSHSKKEDDSLKTFSISWESRIQRSVDIKAHSVEEAHAKWVEGEYGDTDIDDEDLINKFIDIDGDSYYYDQCKKYE